MDMSVSKLQEMVKDREAVMVFTLAGMAAFDMPRTITSLYGLVIIFVILLMEKKSFVKILSLIPWKKQV